MESHNMSKEELANICKEVNLRMKNDIEQYHTECNNMKKWKSNPEKCSGCVKKVSKTDGKSRGCMYCDEYWDVPELIKIN